MKDNKLSTSFLFPVILLLTVMNFQGCTPPVQVPENISISIEQASGLAAPALHCVQKPYPYKPGNVLVDDSTLKPPRVQHPAFYGCFDWHSSVHGHWTLIKLLKEFPDLPEGDEIRMKLAENLSAENIAMETDFFYSEGNKTFERTYGWAWLLKLSLELETWDDPLGTELAQNLKPLSDSLVEKYLAFLKILPYPIRVGEHTNTAFGLSFAWDYADYAGMQELKYLIEKRAKDFYLEDQECPLSWEPSGFDFLSPCLMEADLMSRILDDKEYRAWIKEFLPGILKPAQLNLSPAKVTDRTDPKIVHLDGLNFSRAWCLYHISAKLEGASHLQELAIQHLNTSLPYIATGNYEGEHWLASFAVFSLYSNGKVKE